METTLGSQIPRFIGMYNLFFPNAGNLGYCVFLGPLFRGWLVLSQKSYPNKSYLQIRKVKKLSSRVILYNIIQINATLYQRNYATTPLYIKNDKVFHSFSTPLYYKETTLLHFI